MSKLILFNRIQLLLGPRIPIKVVYIVQCTGLLVIPYFGKR